MSVDRGRCIFSSVSEEPIKLWLKRLGLRVSLKAFLIQLLVIRMLLATVTNKL